MGETIFVGTTFGHRRAFALRYRANDLGIQFATDFDTIYCAGAAGEKWLATQGPDAGAASDDRSIEALSRAPTRRVVLVSTVDVFGHAVGADQNTTPVPLSSYGQHPSLRRTGDRVGAGQAQLRGLRLYIVRVRVGVFYSFY